MSDYKFVNSLLDEFDFVCGYCNEDFCDRDELDYIDGEEKEFKCKCGKEYRVYISRPVQIDIEVR